MIADAVPEVADSGSYVRRCGGPGAAGCWLALHGGQSVVDVANELDYLGTAVLSPFSVEFAADAEQAAVDVLQAHPPADS